MPSPLGEGGTIAGVSEPERADEGNKNLIIKYRRFPLIRLAFATLRQSTFPRGGRLNRLRKRCHSGASVEKSHTIETETVVYVMRRDEGVPSYRRIRRESDTRSFRALAKKFPRDRNGT